MADEKDIIEELIDARMASKGELENLELGKERPLAASLKDRMGLIDDVSESMVDEDELAKRMSGASTIDDIAGKSAKSGSRMANKAEKSMLQKIGSKIGGKGLSKVASGIAALPLLLASEAADASEIGESPEDENIMISEANALKNYSRSPARADKLGLEPMEESDEDFFAKLRSMKDERRDNILEGQKDGADIKEMLDTKEAILDISESDMPREEREEAARVAKEKKKRELGL